MVMLIVPYFHIPGVKPVLNRLHKFAELNALFVVLALAALAAAGSAGAHWG